MTGASKIMVSATSFPELSKDRSKILMKPDLKPIAIVESDCDVVNLSATSLLVVNSVTTSMLSEFHM